MHHADTIGQTVLISLAVVLGLALYLSEAIWAQDFEEVLMFKVPFSDFFDHVRGGEGAASLDKVLDVELPLVVP